jgi:hypothetical protein
MALGTGIALLPERSFALLSRRCRPGRGDDGGPAVHRAVRRRIVGTARRPTRTPALVLRATVEADAARIVPVRACGHQTSLNAAGQLRHLARDARHSRRDGRQGMNPIRSSRRSSRSRRRRVLGAPVDKGFSRGLAFPWWAPPAPSRSASPRSSGRHADAPAAAAAPLDPLSKSASTMSSETSIESGQNRTTDRRSG